MDKISLNQCRFYGYHGAFKEEQVLGQVFTVDCDLYLDLTTATATDLLEDTVHYGLVFDCIRKIVEGEPYRLLERLAGQIFQEIFEAFPRVEKMRLAIYKENPPIAGHYASVGIELERERP